MPQIDFIEDTYFSAEYYIFSVFSIAAFITRGDFGVGVNILEADLRAGMTVSVSRLKLTHDDFSATRQEENDSVEEIYHKSIYCE